MEYCNRSAERSGGTARSQLGFSSCLTLHNRGRSPLSLTHAYAAVLMHAVFWISEGRAYCSLRKLRSMLYFQKTHVSIRSAIPGLAKNRSTFIGLQAHYNRQSGDTLGYSVGTTTRLNLDATVDTSMFIPTTAEFTMYAHTVTH